MSMISTTSFIKYSNLLSLEEGVTLQKCEFFKSQVIAKIKKEISLSNSHGGMLQYYNNMLITISRRYDDLIKALLKVTDKKYYSINGKEPFNPNKYTKNLLMFDECLEKLANTKKGHFLDGMPDLEESVDSFGEIGPLEKNLGDVSSLLARAEEDCEKRIDYLEMWDIGTKLGLINEPMPSMGVIFYTLYELKGPGNVRLIPYLQELINGKKDINRKDMLLKVKEWLDDKSECETTVLYNENNITIIHPLNKVSYLKYGFGTEWCTSIPNLRSGVLETRGVKFTDVESIKAQILKSCADYPDALIVLQNNALLYQIDTKSNQFMDVTDDSFGAATLVIDHHIAKAVETSLNTIHCILNNHAPSPNLFSDTAFILIKALNLNSQQLAKFILPAYRNHETRILKLKKAIPLELQKAFMAIFILPSIYLMLDYAAIINEIFAKKNDILQTLKMYNYGFDETEIKTRQTELQTTLQGLANSDPNKVAKWILGLMTHESING